MKKQANITAGQAIKNGKLIYTSVVINASPESIWSILMDFNNYQSWNPFITSISGNAAASEKLSVTICLPGKSAMTLRPTILQCRTNKEFRWMGSLFIPYLFDGEHTFIIDDNGDGSCTFHHFENFRGLLVPLFKKMLDVNTLRGFELMNAKLKERAEGKETSPRPSPKEREVNC